MRITELQNGQEVRARLGRYVETVVCDNCVGSGLDGRTTQHVTCERCGGSGRVKAIEPEWMPWRSHLLYVQRNADGEIVTIALHGISWAEYRPDDYSDEYNVFESEGYYLQIEGLAEA